jgi:putative SOS response-associated peptidase YedK
MCGRYTMTVDKNTIERHFGAKFISGHFESTSYNAAPSQLLPIIRTHHADRIELAKWGFVREDWNNARSRPQNNARFETAARKPMFADSFAGRHYMVLADSFYEWKTVGTRGLQPLGSNVIYPAV